MNLTDLKKYDYVLPEELIRKEGVEPRDSARLFVYDTKTDTITHDTFLNLAKYLPEHSVLVLNDTKVVPARLHLKKATGGKIEVFVLMNEMSQLPPPLSEGRAGRGGYKDFSKPLSLEDSTAPLGKGGQDLLIPVLVDRKCGVGWKLFFPNGDYFEMIRQEENRFFAKLHSPLLNPPLRKGEEVKKLNDLLDEFGETPIPPYLKGEEWLRDEKKLRERYQTVFADSGKSVAAPTAALHFTDRVFRSLREKHIAEAHVTLDVGLGTFAKLKDEHFAEKKLHHEWIEVSSEAAEKINQAKREKRSVITVGTTALRTLESVALGVIPGLIRDPEIPVDSFIKPFSGYTNIFISPPHHFRSADILITNFHIPKSSLMLLVDAFLQDKGAKRNLVQLYEEAIREKYAFYSLGDSMLIL